MGFNGLATEQQLARQLAIVSRAAQLLGPGGPFDQGLSSFQPRPGQMAMAEQVERCLSEGGVSLLEAGTGTGKTLAYLVPVLLANTPGRIVISTATRALQDQIFHKDLPLAMRLLGVSPEVALIKGLTNYVCQRRLQQVRSTSLEAPRARSLQKVERWLERTSTGAIEEVSELSEDDPVWPLVTASSERRIGAGCHHYESCFVTQMKREAARARILVVNHHLLLADAKVRGPHAGSVLPDFEAVIFDEAHQLEDIAAQHFGYRVSSGQLHRLAQDTVQWLERFGDVSARGLGFAVQTAAERLRLALVAALGLRASLPVSAAGAAVRYALSAELWSGPAQEAWFELDTALEAVLYALMRAEEASTSTLSDAPGGSSDAQLGMLQRRAGQLREQLSTVVEHGEGLVSWAELSEQTFGVSACPADVSPLLQQRLFEVVPSVVLTSATLADRSGEASGAASRENGLELGGAEASAPGHESSPFAFVRQRLGLQDSVLHIQEGVYPSPFDFQRQALLYVPDDLPLPMEPGFSRAVVQRTLSLLEDCRGGAFLLTTSLRSLSQLAGALQAGLAGRRPLLWQGQAPRAALLSQFRDAGNAVLVATSGFWQGVDVPGAALSLVVLEKIPFPVPTEPLIQARSEALEAAGESPFVRLHIPLAQLSLKQGFGRLIRSPEDMGVVALLDGRAHRRGYGKRLLAGLPPATRTSELATAREFLRRMGEEMSPGMAAASTAGKT